MGRDKAGLRFGGETLLERVVRRMRAVADPVLLAVPPDMERVERTVPVLERVIVVPDRTAHEGPLVGLAEGFRRLHDLAERVLVMPVDMPFFTEPWLERLAQGLSASPVVLYRCEGYENALTAGYRLSLLPKLERLIAEGARRPIALAQGESTLVLVVEELWRPGETPPPLMDVDRPEDYRDALRWEGFGDAAGAPVWVRWKPQGPARETAEPSAPIRIPLWARTAEQALEFAASLYPECAERFHAPHHRSVARVLRGGQEPEIPWDAALQAEDTLLCDA